MKNATNCHSNKKDNPENQGSRRKDNEATGLSVILGDVAVRCLEWFIVGVQPVLEAGQARDDRVPCQRNAAWPKGKSDCHLRFSGILFGHCKGAFTGAIRNHSGLMRAAHGGTLFLDEIGEMPRSFQAKLLRSLQERQVRPVGGIQDEPVDIRVISATHVDLNQAMKDGAFREDLYYRLNVVSLNLPKLSERPDDIAWLVDSFLEHLARSYGEVAKNFTPDALNLLKTCPWPGNVRQLRNVVEHCVALSTTSEIAASLVSKALCHPDWSDFPCFEEARTRFEQDYLLRLMHITAGNVARAARLARRNRTEFYRLLTRHCIEPSTFQ